MKKYKLLKELPWIKVGTILLYDNLVLKTDTDFLIPKWKFKILEWLKETIEKNEYKEWLEEIKKPKSIYEL